MLTNNFSEFYNNWSAKAEAIGEQNLASLFDKYVTLFIMYNSLYSLIPEHLIRKGEHIRPNIQDVDLAVGLVIKVVGHENLLNNLLDKGHQEDIDILIELIANERFYIKLYFGQRQRNEDLKILLKLQSANRAQKMVGILQVIYYVRCNLIHGHKDFIAPQGELIQPLINILTTINRHLYQILDR